MKGKPWRVRVKRLVEDWVEVHADTAREAELLAGVLPGVALVFDSSAVPGGKLASEPTPAIGVEDEEHRRHDQ